MKISLRWLEKFVTLPKIAPRELADLFTIRTAEVEGVENEAEALDGMVVGKIITIKPHPNADKLRIAHTDIGKETTQIVCGGANIREGQFVPVALPGSRVRWHGKGDMITLEKAVLRGVESAGMICAGEEIGLPATPEGIMDLEAWASRLGIEKKHLKPGTPLAKVLQKDDIILEIDNKSLTHRPDCWGHYGIAREMAAIFKTKLVPYEKAVKMATEKDLTGKTKGKDSLKIRITDKEICPRFSGCIVTNVRVTESPAWLKKALNAIGVRPVNNIVDITNYVMYELGQPMHAYDRRIVESDMMEIRYAKKGESLETIDHKRRALFDEDPIITNGKTVLTIAGIMGGAHAEIGDNTTEIILEAANWNPAVVRRASTRHGLRTDAVQRFEKSLDPTMTLTALLRAIALIVETSPGAQLAGGIIDIYPKKNTQPVITLDTEKVRQKIGVNIPVKEMVDILERLACTVKTQHKRGTERDILKITVPTWRATKDLKNEDDLIEEVARLTGYEKITPRLPHLPIGLPEPNRFRTLEHACRDILSRDLNCTEVFNYSFYSKETFEAAHLPADLHLAVQNYLSADQTHLRVSLIPGILKNIQSNLRFKDEFVIYEIGRTYRETHEFFPREETWICGAVVSPKGAAAHTNTDTFLTTKGLLHALAHKLSLQTGNAIAGKTPHAQAHPHKYLELPTDAEQLESAPASIRLFDLHPLIAKNFDLDLTKTNITIFEVNVTQLVQVKKHQQIYKPLSKFPGITFDVACIIDKKKTCAELTHAIRTAGSPFIRDVELFDQYEGNGIDVNKKSLAFHITLLAPDRTLTENDMKTAHTDIEKILKHLGAEIR